MTPTRSRRVSGAASPRPRSRISIPTAPVATDLISRLEEVQGAASSLDLSRQVSREASASRSRSGSRRASRRASAARQVASGSGIAVRGRTYESSRADLENWRASTVAADVHPEPVKRASSLSSKLGLASKSTPAEPPTASKSPMVLRVARDVNTNARLTVADEFGRTWRLTPCNTDGSYLLPLTPKRERKSRTGRRSRRESHTERSVSCERIQLPKPTKMKSQQYVRPVPGDSSPNDETSDTADDYESPVEKTGGRESSRMVRTRKPQVPELEVESDESEYENHDLDPIAAARIKIMKLPMGLGQMFLQMWESMPKKGRVSLVDFASSVTKDETPAVDIKLLRQEVLRQRLQETDTFHIDITPPTTFALRPVLSGQAYKRKMAALKHHFPSLGKFLKGDGRDGKTSDVCDVLEHLTKAQENVRLHITEFLDELIKAFTGPDQQAVKALVKLHPQSKDIAVLYKKLVHRLYQKESPARAQEILDNLKHVIPWKTFTEANSEIRRYAQIASYDMVAGAKRDATMDCSATKALFDIIPPNILVHVKAEANRIKQGIHVELTFDNFCNIASAWREQIDEYLNRFGGKKNRNPHKGDHKSTPPAAVQQVSQEKTYPPVDRKPRDPRDKPRDKSQRRRQDDQRGPPKGNNSNGRQPQRVQAVQGKPPQTGGNAQKVGPKKKSSSKEGIEWSKTRMPAPEVQNYSFDPPGQPPPLPKVRNTFAKPLGSAPCQLCPSVRHCSADCPFFPAHRREAVHDICSLCDWGKRHAEDVCLAIRQGGGKN